MSATDAFLAAWRNSTFRAPATLALITFTTPAATLRVATRHVDLPDGTTWEDGLSADPLTMRIDQLGTGPEPADCTIHLAERDYPTIGFAAASMATHAWHGANVKLYLWEMSLTSASDLFQVFEGTVDSYSLTDGDLTLNLLQPRSWNKPAPSLVIDKSTYPNAPDGTQGIVLPVVYGDHRAFPLRQPHSAAYGTNQQRRDEAGAASGTLPFVLVDPGTGSANVKIVAAGHPCLTINDRANGYSSFIVADSVLAPLDPTGTSVVAGSDGSAQLSINDDTMLAYFGVLPIDVRAASNSALNPRRAMDPFDETSFATLNQTAGQNVLELQLPNMASLGVITALDVNVCFIGNAANTQQIRCYPYNPIAAVAGTVVSAVSTGTVPAMLPGTWDNAWANQSWQFGGMNLTAPDRTTIDIRIDFAGAVANNKASILWASVRVKFKPQRNLSIPGTTVTGGGVDSQRPLVETDPFPWLTHAAASPDQFSVTADFYGNLKGYADDGSGTYTGVAGGLVELPPDIARHFLATYGAQTQFVTTPGAFGSFVDARWKLKNGAVSHYKMAGRVGSQTTVQQQLQTVCAQALCCCLYDTQSSSWMFHVWRTGDVADYPYTFTLEDCQDLFDCGATSDVSLAQGVRIQYGYDYFKGRTQFEAFATAVGSSQGYTEPTWRDQANVVITNANKYIDVICGSTVAATVALGTYTSPDALAQAVTTALGAALPATRILLCGWGFNVIAGYNDSLIIQIDAVTQTLTIPPANYQPDMLAHVITDLIAENSAFTTKAVCGWSEQYNEFTFTVTTATTVQPGFAGANAISPAWVTLGWDSWWVQNAYAGAFGANPTAGAFLRSPNPRWSETYWIGIVKCAIGDDLQLKWKTGANAASNCATELGFDDLDLHGTALTQTPPWWPTWGYHGCEGWPSHSRGMREAVAVTSQATYGPKQDAPVSLDWVRDEVAATQYRNRLFDFGSVPRGWVRFRSHACPDMQRMRVIEFDASLDSRRPFPKYGSDGSWAGKTFRALEVVIDLGPSYHTEIYALEA